MKVSEIRSQAIAAGADLPGTRMYSVWMALERSLCDGDFTACGVPYKQGDERRDEMNYAGDLLVAPVCALLKHQTSTWRWPFVHRWYSIRRMWRRFVRRPALDLWEHITIG